MLIEKKTPRVHAIMNTASTSWNPGILPIWPLLEFLDWDDRLQVFGILPNYPLNPQDASVRIAWILRRVLLESFLIPMKDLELPVQVFVLLRHSITGESRREEIPRMLTGGCVCINLPHSGPNASGGSFEQDLKPYMVPECAGSRLTYNMTRKSLRSLKDRLSVRARMPSSLSYTLNDHTVMAFASGFLVRSFRLDNVKPNLTSILNLEDSFKFLNGRDILYILMGSDQERYSLIILLVKQLMNDIYNPFTSRATALPSEVYSSHLQISLMCINRSRTRTLWCTKGLPPTFSGFEEVVNAYQDIDGQLCCKVSLTHEYILKQPGIHVNSFIIAIPRRMGRMPETSRHLCLDMFSLSEALRSLLSAKNRSVARSNRYLKFLSPQSCDSIRVVVVASDASSRSRRETLQGLRFAEQFSLRCRGTV